MPFIVCNLLALNASLTTIPIESIDLISLPLNSIVPKVCVLPKAVKLFGIVTSFGKDKVNVSGGVTTL